MGLLFCDSYFFQRLTTDRKYTTASFFRPCMSIFILKHFVVPVEQTLITFVVSFVFMGFLLGQKRFICWELPQ